MKKRNHYLSVFYLKGWRDASTPHGLIHRYTLGSLSHVIRNVKNVGWCHKLTICDPPASDGELVENHISDWERKGAGPFSELRDRHVLPQSDDDRINLWVLFCVRKLLSPEQQRLIGEKTAPAYLSDVGRNLERKLGPQVTIRPDPESPLVVVRNTREWVIESFGKTPQIAKMCGLYAIYVTQTAAYTSSLKMKLHVVPPDSHVVLTDNPLIISGSNAGSENPTVDGEKDTVRWVPVSSSAFLSVSSAYQSDEVVTATKEEADWLNASLIKSAYRYVFSSRDDGSIATQVLATKPKTDLDYE